MWRWRRGLITLGAIALAALVAPSVASAGDESPSWRADLRWGIDLDSNTRRADAQQQSGDGLTRLLLDGSVSHDIGEAVEVQGQWLQGASVHRRDRGHDNWITDVEVGLRIQQGAWWLGPRAGWKDRSERDPDWPRDYTRSVGGLRGGWQAQRGQVWLEGQATALDYKPNRDADFWGPSLGAGATLHWSDNWQLMGSLRSRWRRFDTSAIAVGDQGVEELESPRRDRFESASIGLLYRGPLVGQITYRYGRNRSNSFGQAMGRHAIEGRLTAPLPMDTFLSARLELQRARYEDEVRVDDTFYIDEDNRNTLVTALRRPIRDDLWWEVRYSRYRQVFGADQTYHRQILGVALEMQFGADEI